MKKHPLTGEARDSGERWLIFEHHSRSSCLSLFIHPWPSPCPVYEHKHFVCSPFTEQGCVWSLCFWTGQLADCEEIFTEFDEKWKPKSRKCIILTKWSVGKSGAAGNLSSLLCLPSSSCCLLFTYTVSWKQTLGLYGEELRGRNSSALQLAINPTVRIRI